MRFVVQRLHSSTRLSAVLMLGSSIALVALATSCPRHRLRAAFHHGVDRDETPRSAKVAPRPAHAGTYLIDAARN